MEKWTAPLWGALASNVQVLFSMPPEIYFRQVHCQTECLYMKVHPKVDVHSDMVPRYEYGKKDNQLDATSDDESGEDKNRFDAGKPDAACLPHAQVAPVTHATETAKDYRTPESIGCSEEHLVDNGSNAPYLPAHILESTTADSSHAQLVHRIPRKQMTSREKKRQRNSVRRAKKREYDMMRRAAENNGVLEAGSAAQSKRGIIPSRDKVKSGRVMKKQKTPQVSGRQQVLDQRKLLVSATAQKRPRPGRKD